MNKPLLDKLLELPAAERLEIIGELWDSIPPQELPPLSDELKDELDRRYEALVHDPGRGSSWEEVKERLLAKYK
jgi:putative addiction module component (TIGR02574 family)